MSNFFDITKEIYKSFLTECEAVKVPEDFAEITNAIFNKLKWRTKVNTYKIADIVVPEPEENKKVYVGLSAGLDSVYQATHLKALGYEVTAVHLKGLNKQSAEQEYASAKSIAQKLGIKLIVVNFKTPKQELPDNPFKNQLVLSIMLDRGIKEGVYRYALGSDWCSSLNASAEKFTLTDSIEVNKSFENFVKKHYKPFELLFIDEKVKKVQRLGYIMQNNMALFEDISSCISPQRFRQYWKAECEKKYRIGLPKNRCGKCYKCCMEYLLLCELGLGLKQEGYYNYCWQVLAKSKNSHYSSLFDLKLPLEKRRQNLLNYGS